MVCCACAGAVRGVTQGQRCVMAGAGAWAEGAALRLRGQCMGWRRGKSALAGAGAWAEGAVLRSCGQCIVRRRAVLAGRKYGGAWQARWRLGCSF